MDRLEEKHAESSHSDDPNEFQLDALNDQEDLFLSELGNILMSAEANSGDHDESEGDVNRIIRSIEREQERFSEQPKEHSMLGAGSLTEEDMQFCSQPNLQRTNSEVIQHSGSKAPFDYEPSPTKYKDINEEEIR